MSQEVKSADNHGGHPTPSTYVKVALALTSITAVEVGIFYLEWLSYSIIPILVILSGAKFAIVVMFYMHLKFDSRLFTGMFFAGFIIASGVIITLMALFKAF